MAMNTPSNGMTCISETEKSRKEFDWSELNTYLSKGGTPDSGDSAAELILVAEESRNPQPRSLPHKNLAPVLVRSKNHHGW